MELAIALLVLHGLACLYCWRMIKKGKLHVERACFATVALIPLFGFISVYFMQRAILKRQAASGNAAPACDENLRFRVQVEREALDLVIPLEEALLINDERTRRSIMINLMQREPERFLDVLRLARFSDDVEVAHYATTAIMGIQRQYDLAFTRAHAEISRSPDDADALDSYIGILTNHIDSGLLHGYLLRAKQELLSKALLAKVALVPHDKDSYFAIIKNDLRLGLYGRADETASHMIERWPQDEAVWIAAMGVVMKAANRSRKATLMRMMEDATVHWSAEGRKSMAFMLDGNARVPRTAGKASRANTNVSVSA